MTRKDPTYQQAAQWVVAYHDNNPNQLPDPETIAAINHAHTLSSSGLWEFRRTENHVIGDVVYMWRFQFGGPDKVRQLAEGKTP